MKSFLKVLFLVQLLAVSACSQQTESTNVPETENITIQNYQQCVKLGGIILKTYPPKCRTKSGAIYTSGGSTSKALCNNLCGDGICQEIVCLGTGCACAESVDSCPKDCMGTTN